MGDLIFRANGHAVNAFAELVAQIKETTPDQTLALDVTRNGRQLQVPVRLGEVPQPKVLWNAQRPKRRGGFLSSWASATEDPLRLGKATWGVIEKSDALFDDGTRVDLYLLAQESAGKPVRAVLDTQGQALKLRLYQDECQPGNGVGEGGKDSNGNLGIMFTSRDKCTWLAVYGKPANTKPYLIMAFEQTPYELAYYTKQLREQQVAQQQRRQQEASEPSTFGAIVRGLAMGFSGVEAPLMNADGSEVNTLDVLNAAGAELARKNAESARQLDESVAHAQAEGRRQAAEEEARRQAESESARMTAEARSQAGVAAAQDKADQAAGAEREAAQAERVRLAEAARDKAKADKARKDAEDLAARERAATEARQRAEQQKRQDESALRSSFSGRASTCAGGGSGVLYLQTSRPPKQGCNVQFEARCPGTQPGNGVSFGQNNYIGGSCMGIGDAIQIGTMACPADQVMIQMTGATCR